MTKRHCLMREAKALKKGEKGRRRCRHNTISLHQLRRHGMLVIYTLLDSLVQTIPLPIAALEPTPSHFYFCLPPEVEDELLLAGGHWPQGGIKSVYCCTPSGTLRDSDTWLIRQMCHRASIHTYQVARLPW